MPKIYFKNFDDPDTNDYSNGGEVESYLSMTPVAYSKEMASALCNIGISKVSVGGMLGHYRRGMIKTPCDMTIGSILAKAPYRNLKDTRSKIRHAMSCASEDEGDDLVNSMISLKSELSVNGFNVQPIMDESEILDILVNSTRGETQGIEVTPDGVEDGFIPMDLVSKIASYKRNSRTMSDFCRAHDIKKVAYDLFEDWYVTDNMVLFWNVSSSGEIVTICSLRPDSIEYDNSSGNEKIHIDLPQELADIAKIASTSRDRNDLVIEQKIQRLISSGRRFPDHWLDAARRGEFRAELLAEAGDRFRVRSRERKHCGLSVPSMCTVFPEIYMRKLMREGLVGSSYMMKHFIFHAKTGEPITSGDLAGQRNNYATPADLSDIQSKISSPEQAFRMTTNHTVTFDYVYPPKEMWTRDRFEHPDFAIHNWLGVNAVLSSGRGNSTSGYISNKRLVCHIEHARSEVADCLMAMFSDETIRRSMNIECPDSFSVNIVFNDQVLKEQRLVMQESSLLVNSGFGDPFTLLEEMDRDPTQMLMNKFCAMIIDSVTRVYSPMNAFVNRSYQGSAGDRIDSENQQGRPPSDGVQPNEGTRQQRGRNAT